MQLHSQKLANGKSGFKCISDSTAHVLNSNTLLSFCNLSWKTIYSFLCKWYTVQNKTVENSDHSEELQHCYKHLHLHSSALPPPTYKWLFQRWTVIPKSLSQKSGRYGSVLWSCIATVEMENSGGYFFT